MKSVKGTKTEKNILAAFIGESQARNKYTYWASKAKDEGFIQIQQIFLETAEQEKEHAKRLFKFLEGGAEVNAGAGGHAGFIGTTLENLKQAAGGENYEWQHMYPDFAKVAREEGFEEIAKAMDSIGVAEKFHGERYRKLAANIQKGIVFTREDPKTVWRCRNCGYLHVGTTAPDVCPACAHPQAYFEILGENW